jgi:hypothetical protein
LFATPFFLSRFFFIIPAEAEIRSFKRILDSRFRRSDRYFHANAAARRAWVLPAQAGIQSIAAARFMIAKTNSVMPVSRR